MKMKRYDRALLEALQEVVIVVDRDHRILDLNEAAVKLLGGRRQDILGKLCYEVTHGLGEPCHLSGTRCLVREVFENGRPASTVHRHVRQDGSRVWEEVLASPLLDEQGEVLAVVEELRDVAELLKMREIIEQLEGELRILRGFIPVCSNCKKIRAPDGTWEGMEKFLEANTEASITHGMCPDCVRELYPTFNIDR